MEKEEIIAWSIEEWEVITKQTMTIAEYYQKYGKIPTKEYKEVIREEARVLENKILWWKAERSPYTEDKWKFLVTWWKQFTHLQDTFTTKELLALWFEPIEEPKKDWIDKAFDYFEADSDGEMRPDARKIFVEAIEKHMPQPHQVTMDELLNTESVYYQSTLEWEKLLRRWSVVDLLRSKGLLKE